LFEINSKGSIHKISYFLRFGRVQKKKEVTRWRMTGCEKREQESLSSNFEIDFKQIPLASLEV
jgi:hypothetical protein